MNNTYLRFLTGLRGYSILGVVSIHYLFSYKAYLNDFSINLIEYGLYGVHIFFVISGYCVAQSFVASANYYGFLIKRFKRIAPAYYFFVFITLMFNYFAADGAGHILQNLTPLEFLKVMSFFVFWSKSESFIGAYNILGVEWSLGVEAFFYICFPLLFWFSKSRFRLIALYLLSYVVLLLFSYVISRYNNLIFGDFIKSTLAIYHFPLAFLINFATGLAAWKIRSISMQSKALFIVAASVITFSMPSYVVLFNGKLCLFLLFFIVFAEDSNFIIKLLFNNFFIQMVGLMSYSIYLSHMFSISFLSSYFGGLNLLIGSVMLTFLLSFLSYRYIESGRLWSNRSLA